MSKDDLKADLLADLAPRVEPEPAAPQVPAVAPEPVDLTPALSLDITPLRWSRPRFVRSTDGLGKALRVGPLTVQLAVKED